jgi:hypothetical protein
MKSLLFWAAAGSALGVVAWLILWCVVWEKPLVGYPQSTAIVMQTPYWVDFAAGTICFGVPTGALLGVLGGWIVLRVRERAQERRAFHLHRTSQPNPFGDDASSERPADS